MTRKSFCHEPREVREKALISATLNCVAELGLAKTTVREVAERASVTPGLIGRYFINKDRLVEAAYASFVDEITSHIEKAITDGKASNRLAAFVRVCCTPPIVDSHSVSIWAAFIGVIHANEAVATIHRQGYQSFRKVVEEIIIALAEERGDLLLKERARQHSISINALIDGIWLEVSIADDQFGDFDIVDVVLGSVASILGLPEELLKEC